MLHGPFLDLCEVEQSFILTRIVVLSCVIQHWFRWKMSQRTFWFDLTRYRRQKINHAMFDQAKQQVQRVKNILTLIIQQSERWITTAHDIIQTWVSQVISVCLMLPDYKEKSPDEINQIIRLNSVFVSRANTVYIIK